ncbi:MAG: transglutaminase domain-containing protein [Polyangiales bacterium]
MDALRQLLADGQRLEREGTRYAVARMPEPDRDLGYRVVLDPIDPPVVFTLEGAVGLRVDARYEGGAARYVEFTRDRDDTLRYAGTEGLGIVYQVYVPRAPEPPPRSELDRVEPSRERYLQLPNDLSPEVRRLAERVTAGEVTALGKARAVERYLSRFRYTLDLESGSAERPMEDFLFRTRAGHCEYFSTAMAVMLRTVGVPTRNVTGFLGGTFNRYGRFYAVHQGDAHSWVEVWDARQGWVTFEPTPAVGTMPAPHEGVLAETDALVEALRMRWRNYVVAFDLNTQARIALRVWRFLERHHGNEWLSPNRWLVRRPPARATAARTSPAVPWRRVGAWALVLGALAAIAWQARGLARLSGGSSRAAPPSVRAAQELARALDQCLSARGHARPSSRSPLAFAGELSARRDPLGPLALRVAERYMAARYGADPLGGDELTRLRAELQQAARAPATA